MVERYLINYDGRGEQLHPSGDFVHYSDYANLESQLDEARAEIERLKFAYNREIKRATEQFNRAARAEAALAQEGRKNG